LHDNVGRSLEVDYDKVDALIVIGTSLSVYVCRLDVREVTVA
jgi:NAD-dependent SIR2 family protein deacetylase